MSGAAARVTGIVLRVEERSGNKVNEQTGEMRAWKMTTAKVLVGGEDLCPVTLPENVLTPEKGEAIDWLVSIRAGGRFLNIDYLGAWTEEHTAQSS